jgi:DnaK suppressor protein
VRPVDQPGQRLARDLAENEDQIARLELDHARMIAAAESSNGDDEHDPEGATIAFEREQLTAQLAVARRTGADLRSALDQLDRGTYGVCANCGAAIDPERLLARPQARLCINCARGARRR